MSISKILYSLVIVVIVGSVLFLLATLLPIPGNYEVRIVKSGSMEPAIHTGAVVIMRPSPVYKVDDVVTFNRGKVGDMPTTHRIIKVIEDGGVRSYITKGDANGDADMGQVTDRHILGKVRLTVPFIGYVVTAAKTPLGFFFLIIFPAGLVALEAVMTLVKEIMAISRRSKSKESKKNSRDTITEPASRSDL